MLNYSYEYKGGARVRKLDLDINYIEYFALAYNIATEVFKIEPTKASARKQRSIRKWVERTYVDREELPEKVLQYVDSFESDREYIEFLKDCEAYIAEHGTWKRQLFDKVAGEFPETVNRAFRCLFFETGYCEEIEIRDNEVVLCIEEVDNYRQILTLHHTGEKQLEKYDFLEFNDAQILKENTGYRLFCFATDSAREQCLPITIHFTYATCEVEVFCAEDVGRENPWEKLEFISNMILSKHQLGEEYLNQQELALLPLLKELRKLNVYTFTRKEENDFPVLKQYLEKYHLDKISSMLDKYTAQYGKKNTAFLVHQINAKLCESKCEPLWRELYVLLQESQQSYPRRPVTCDENLLNIRKRIEQNLHAKGYTGTYPTFRKNGSMKKIHLEQSYGQLYHIGFEKNVEYIIQCCEAEVRGFRSITFMCGTALLKKDEKVEDIYSCCFQAQGRRLIKTLFWDTTEIESLDCMTTCAAKRAECLSLNKEERKLISTEKTSWAEFVGVFLVCGGLFTILMMAAMFIILCVVDAILFGISDIPKMLGEMPWGSLSAFCFFGFGITMAVCQRLASLKG